MVKEVLQEQEPALQVPTGGRSLEKRGWDLCWSSFSAVTALQFNCRDHGGEMVGGEGNVQWEMCSGK